ncbi:MAG: alpha/beta hydrolase [Ottowia sp.]|nr:alpha/beta hydrolase [Ottowia sp.]
MIGFALCHGWAFDASAMRLLSSHLRAYFPQHKQAFFDLGFTGTPHTPRLDKHIHWIAIGHSYGFAYLMQHNIDWRGAIAINGFTRFCQPVPVLEETDKATHKSRPRNSTQGIPAWIIDAMYARLLVDTHGTIAAFYARCIDVGTIELPIPTTLVREALALHLKKLRDTDMTLPICPLLAIAACDDTIVSTTQARAQFQRHPKMHYIELTGNHLLPLTATQACANAIAQFLASLSMEISHA